MQLASSIAGSTEPDHPPLATLSWKDWQGGAELWVRGVRRSTPPERTALAPGQFEESIYPRSALDPDPLDHRAVRRARRLRRRRSGGRSGPRRVGGHVGPRSASHPPEAECRRPWTRRSRPSAYAAASRTAAPLGNPPAARGNIQSIAPRKKSRPLRPAQRVLAGEELVGALFERMHELLYLPDLAAGASYVLETLEEFIPCAGAPDPRF